MIVCNSALSLHYLNMKYDILQFETDKCTFLALAIYGRGKKIDGLYQYSIRQSDDVLESATVEKRVWINHYYDIYTNCELPIDEYLVIHKIETVDRCTIENFKSGQCCPL